MTAAATSVVIPGLQQQRENRSSGPEQLHKHGLGNNRGCIGLWMNDIDLHMISLLGKGCSELGMTMQHAVFGCVNTLLQTRRNTGGH